jgi:copper chaperone
VKFHIVSMACGGCVRSVTRIVEGVDPGAVVTADLDSHVVTITSTQPEASIAAALAKGGYPAAPLPGQEG